MGLTSNARRLFQKANDLDARKLYFDALQVYEEVCKTSREIGDTSIILASLNNMGLIFETLEDLKHALVKYKESITVAEENKDQVMIGLGLYNISRVYRKEKKYSKALRFLNESLNILSRTELENRLKYIIQEIQSSITEIKHIIQAN